MAFYQIYRTQTNWSIEVLLYSSRPLAITVKSRSDWL